MIIRFLLYVLLAISSPLLHGMQENIVATTIDIKSAKAITTAYSKFATNAKDINCFEAYVESTENEIVVSFLMKNAVILKGDIISKSKLDIDHCGISKSYIFDINSGELIKELFQK
ncbi:hypothetical protein [Pseudoalteromonas sp. bablab_jr011]|jgi:hypothetical protein|uniref:hypothetical protein n=1 Tax=Pseudoalteromonas sp. bablab_jr011 TaxID=2755062 RepID=UPI0018F519D7|nr:hypothetical protein [Pseudoalteromonas sp. bablab_jr011]